VHITGGNINDTSELNVNLKNIPLKLESSNEKPIYITTDKGYYSKNIISIFIVKKIEIIFIYVFHTILNNQLINFQLTTIFNSKCPPVIKEILKKFPIQ
jgi:hypothetical protein